MTYDAGWPCCADFTRLTSENAALRAQLTAAEAIAELHLCSCEREQIGAPHEATCVLGRLTAAEQQLREAKAIVEEMDDAMKRLGAYDRNDKYDRGYRWGLSTANQWLLMKWRHLDASPAQPTEGTRE